MEIGNEVLAAQNMLVSTNETQLLELNDVQLALVGGGHGDIILG